MVSSTLKKTSSQSIAPLKYKRLFQRYAQEGSASTDEFENQPSSPIDSSFVDNKDEQIQAALEIAYENDKKVKTIEEEDSPSLSENLILLLGSSSIAMLFSIGLSSFELLQDWRYSWCLIGILYISDGLYNSAPLLVPSAPKKIFNVLEIVCGMGLLIGGAYDLFMPVYMTGPNVFTNAGIHQDSATVLLGLTFYKFATTSSVKVSSTKIPLFSKLVPNKMQSYDWKLLQMILLAQLYILGESSIDELLSYFA